VSVITALEFDDKSRFVTPRASRTALIVASVPLETKRIFSMKGISRVISVASSSSSSVVTPKLVPRRAWSAIASLMAGFACPTIIAPQEHTNRAARFRPRRKGVGPLPRSMISGSPPTDRNARTGLFTPPTSTFSARSKSRANVCVRASLGIALYSCFLD